MGKGEAVEEIPPHTLILSCPIVQKGIPRSAIGGYAVGNRADEG